jgi:hypothetical protein
MLSLSDRTLVKFIEDMMNEVVKFFSKKVEEEFGRKGDDVNNEAFNRAIDIVASTAFVTAEVFGSRLIIYALDPMAFLPINTSSGRCELWDYLQSWASTSGITLCISKYVTSVRKGKEIYKYTKEYILDLKHMVDEEIFTFDEIFFNKDND